MEQQLRILKKVNIGIDILLIILIRIQTQNKDFSRDEGKYSNKHLTLFLHNYSIKFGAG